MVTTETLIKRLMRLSLLLVPFTVIAISMPAVLASGLPARPALRDDGRILPIIVPLDHGSDSAGEDHARHVWTTDGESINARGVLTAMPGAASGRLMTTTESSVSRAAIAKVTAGSPTTLTISPSTSVINAGMNIAYTAVAYDADNILIGDVTGSTLFDITPASGGSFVNNVVTPTVSNAYIVTGTYGAISGTAVLTVTPAAMSKLAIEDAPAGTGAPISNTLLSVYDTLTAYAAGYDAYDNLIGAVPATWDATGILSGRLSPITGISTVLTPAPILSGSGVITAAYNSFTRATGLITIQVPLLKISKTANPDPVEPGNALQYTIIYTNAGSVTAQDVVITETYPAGTSYNLASPLPTSGNNVWSIGNLVPGGSAAIVVSLRVTDSLPVGSVLTDVVRIGAAKSATAVYTMTTSVVSAPLLDVSLDENIDPVRVGSDLVYVINYRNNGTASATGIRITETFPSEVSFVAANPPPTLTPTVGSRVWLPPNLGAGTSGPSILVTVRVHSPLPDLTSLNNQVAIRSNELPTPVTTTQATLVQAPILTLRKLASDPSPQANSLLTYTLPYTNSGSTYASSVVVTDAVPNNTVFQDCAPEDCSYNPGNRVVTWNLGQVPSQDAESVTMTVSVANNLPTSTVLTNTARIAAAENISALTSLTNTITSQPAINLATDNGVSSAAAGDVLTYTLTYSNFGNAPAQNVVITDRVPSHAAFQGCSNSCVNVGGGVYSFTLGTVNASNGGAVTLRVKVDSPLPAGIRAITNTGVIRTTTLNDDPSDNVAQDVDGISTVPVLALDVNFDASTPFETKIITYSLKYTNTSAMDTTGVTLTVTKSPYVTQLSSGWQDNGDDASLPIGNLAAGAFGVATFSVRLPVTFTPSMTSFANRFVIRDDGPGGLPVASAMTTTVLGVPDLVIDGVSLSPSIVAAGTKFTATLTVRNAGTGRACNPNRLPCVGQGGFYLDAFINPSTPPPSFPFNSYGNTFRTVDPLAPGEITTVVFPSLTFAVSQQPILYFKIDNYSCPTSTCAPSSGQRGLVPESNEGNNVFGPVTVPQYGVYLPLVRKK